MTLEEEFAHYWESITSLNRAWRTLCELEHAEPDNAIWSAAYRMAIVEYCKPFTTSQINRSERFKLPFPKLSDDFENLHKNLLDLRNQVMAHSDLTVLDAQVYYDKNVQFHEPQIVLNVIDDFPKVSEIKYLIESVLDYLYLKEIEYQKRFSRL